MDDLKLRNSRHHITTHGMRQLFLGLERKALFDQVVLI